MTNPKLGQLGPSILNILNGVGFIRIWIQHEKKSFCLSFLCWFLPIFGNIDGETKLAFKYSWLKPITSFKTINLRYNLSEQCTLSLVGAIWNKCRRRKVSLLVSGQMYRVEGELS